MRDEPGTKAGQDSNKVAKYVMLHCAGVSRSGRRILTGRQDWILVFLFHNSPVVIDMPLVVGCVIVHPPEQASGTACLEDQSE